MKQINDDKEYEEYINSDEWKELREIILNRDNYSCVYCGSKNDLEVHHLTYKNFKNEFNAELATLCHFHHSQIHAIDNINIKIEFDEQFKSIKLFEKKDDKFIENNSNYLLNENSFDLLLRVYGKMFHTYKKYNGKKDFVCEKKICQSKAKDELTKLYIKIKKNEKWKKLYNELIEKIENSVDGEIISKDIILEWNKVGYIPLNTKILDLIICMYGKIVKEYNVEIKDGKEVSSLIYKKDSNILNCDYFNINVNIKRCKNCKKEFPLESEYCDICTYKKDTNNNKKGEPYKLIPMQKKPPMCECVVFKMYIDGEKDKTI